MPFSFSSLGRLVRLAVTATLALALVSCGGGGGEPPGAATTTISGSVVDGPVTQSTITISDADGAVILSTLSDEQANYAAAIPADALYPLTITARGGTDLVTGGAPQFTMVSTVLEPSEQTANVTPFTTLIVRCAQALPGGLTADNLATTKRSILDHLNFGFDRTNTADPLSTPVSPGNVANVVKASEALAEMVRRTQATLAESGRRLTEDDVLVALAGDMVDGIVDGRGWNADPRIAATANIVSGQVLLETLRNRIQVSHAEATALMDAAIQSTYPSVTETTADVVITTDLLAQARSAVAANLAFGPSSALAGIATALDGLAANHRASELDALLPGESRDFDPSISQVGAATESELEVINSAVRTPNAGNGTDADPGQAERGGDSTPPPAPELSLTASPSSIAFNAKTLLSWSSHAVSTCRASGDWAGIQATNGSAEIGPLSTDSTFVLSCSGPGGSLTESVAVLVETPTPQRPTVSLSADLASVSFGGTATLSWTSTRSDSCSASGDWSGSKATTGVASVGPLTEDARFNLTCRGPGGEAVDRIQIAVLGVQTVTRGPYLQQATPNSIRVKWRTDVPATSAVYYGESSETLSSSVTRNSPATRHEIELSNLQPGTRYYYRIGNSQTPFASASAPYSFVTSPIPGTPKPTRIWVLGDSGTANADAAAVRDAYKRYTGSRGTDVWLMLGDNAYPNGTDDEYQEAVFDMYPRMLSQVALWPTLGNHDGQTADSDTQSGPYYEIFSLPTNGEAGGVASATEAYYSFDYGNIHFICLESYKIDRSPNGAMMTWLENDLASTNKEWIIAFWHHPPYTKGSHDSDSESQLREMRENALPILESYGVDLVLSGHSHSYERSFLIDAHYGTSDTLRPSMVLDNGNGREEGDGVYRKPNVVGSPNQGAVYAVAGSSGKISDGDFNHPVMYVSLKRLGSMALDVSDTRLDAVFIDDGGTVRDRFTIDKGQ